LLIEADMEEREEGKKEKKKTTQTSKFTFFSRTNVNFKLRNAFFWLELLFFQFFFFFGWKI